MNIRLLIISICILEGINCSEIKQEDAAMMNSLKVQQFLHFMARGDEGAQKTIVSNVINRMGRPAVDIRSCKSRSTFDLETGQIVEYCDDDRINANAKEVEKTSLDGAQLRALKSDDCNRIKAMWKVYFQRSNLAESFGFVRSHTEFDWQRAHWAPSLIGRGASVDVRRIANGRLFDDEGCSFELCLEEGMPRIYLFMGFFSINTIIPNPQLGVRPPDKNKWQVVCETLPEYYKERLKKKASVADIKNELMVIYGQEPFYRHESTLSNGIYSTETNLTNPIRLMHIGSVVHRLDAEANEKEIEENKFDIRKILGKIYIDSSTHQLMAAYVIEGSFGLLK